MYWLEWKLRGFGRSTATARESRKECNLCRFSSPAFLPFGFQSLVLKDRRVIGGGVRPHAVCPRCGSLDRERLVFLYLGTQQLLNRLGAVLHVAPERSLGRILRTRCQNYFSADLKSPDVMIRMDITTIPCLSASFDAIVCNHVLEHIEDDRAAIGELFRVLKPGGWAILQVPISYTLSATLEDPARQSPREREIAFGQRDHVRIYGPDYPDRLRMAGFSVQIFDPLEAFGPSVVARYALIPREVVFVGHKKIDLPRGPNGPLISAQAIGPGPQPALRRNR